MHGKPFSPIVGKVKYKDPRPLFGDLDYCEKERLNRRYPHKEPVEWQCACPACRKALPRPSKGTNGGVGKNSVVSDIAFTSLLTTPRDVRFANGEYSRRPSYRSARSTTPERGRARSVRSNDPHGTCPTRQLPPPLRAEYVRLEDDVFKISYENGDTYHGQVHNNRRNGNGVTTYACGGTLSCWWVDDRPNGYGERRWPDGSIFEGMWKDGKPSGQGWMRYSDGCIYYGRWRDGNREGQGELYDPTSGTVLLGQWEDDRQVAVVYKLAEGGEAYRQEDGVFVPVKIPVFSKILDRRKAPPSPSPSPSPLPSPSPSPMPVPSPVKEHRVPLAIGRSRSAPQVSRVSELHRAQMQYLADCDSESSVSPVNVIPVGRDEYLCMVNGSDQSSLESSYDTPSEHKLGEDSMSGASPKPSPSPRYASHEISSALRASFSPEGLTPGYSSSHASPEYARLRSY
eukprot:TRINITY_DN18443_c0_g1_i1.p1 TRINITY_DN18443_c0_g1~~TRINITY_DN18443_c0_g1_i1.p1  ORF type:complete len:513 (+),score=133.16 TRINITY_DN18443_c0_g1_i1:172-1539(+)